MAKGASGGRRGGTLTGGVNAGDINGTTNLLIDTDLDEMTRGEVTRTLKDFQDKYGLDYYNTRIADMKNGTGVLAYYDGEGIAINKEYLNSKTMNDAYKRCVESGFHPSNGSKTGMEAVVSHELGHGINGLIAESMGMSLDKSAERIVNEAMKNSGHRDTKTFQSKISGYAKYNHAETVAEAMSDYYCNGRKASKESKAIQKVVDKYMKNRPMKGQLSF